MARPLFSPRALVLPLVLALGCEDAVSPPAAAPIVASRAAATSLAFRNISAGGNHSCGVTTGSVAYCWGSNGTGQLGNGTSGNIGTTPVPVAGGLSFRSVGAGLDHSCGVTTANVAYCWGSNNFGQLGTGASGPPALTPVRVAGGLTFGPISAGDGFSCGVTTGGVAYCWGLNNVGQLGDGSTTMRLTPTPVAGGLVFRGVNAGEAHSCGATTSNKAYCWGDNFWGQIGDKTRFGSHLVPTPVAGGLAFDGAVAGQFHSCGITTASKAYCWGLNSDGQVGDGSTVQKRVRPVAVAGGLSFRQVHPGGFHSCGATTGNKAYCWGQNFYGQLGNGTTDTSRTPSPVAGGLSFRQVKTGRDHSCGVTTGDVAYCWGRNDLGQLGDGTTTPRRLTPVAVSP